MIGYLLLRINRSELRQRYVNGEIVENNLYRHPDPYVGVRAPYHGAHHADTFLQFNDGYIIRHVFFKTPGGTMADSKGVYDAPAACPHPINIKRKA